MTVQPLRLPRWLATAVRICIDHPGVDLVLAMLASAVCIVVPSLDRLEDIDVAQRFVWYQSVAAVAASVLGFSLAAITVVFASGAGPRLKHVMETAGVHLTRLLASSLVGLGIVTAGFLGIFLFDGRDSTSNARFIAYGLLIVLILRSFRLGWLVMRVVVIRGRDASGAPLEEIDLPDLSAADYPIERRGRQ